MPMKDTPSRINRRLQKVLLVRPDLLGTPYAISKFGVKHQPMGLFYMASPLIREGFEIRYCDEILLDDFEKAIADFKPDFIGISVSSPLFSRAKHLVSIAQKYNCITGLGGPHITAEPDIALQESKADFGVIGESEIILPKILNGESIETLDGVAFWKNGMVEIRERTSYIDDLDAVPFPAREIADMDRYHGDTEFGFHIHPKERMIRIITSRGCAFHCTFCARHKIFGRKTRKRNPENILDEMDYVHKKYNATHFTLMDDTFTEDVRHVEGFCNEIIKRNRKYTWCAYSRVDTNPDILKLMYDTGCRMLEFGVETGSQKVLDSIKKGITVDEIRQGFDNAKRAGMKTKAFFMVGLPAEGPMELKESIELAKEINPHYLWLSIFLPLPGSEIYENIETGKKIDFSRESFFHTHSADLNKSHRKFMLNFYVRYAYIRQFLKNLTWSEFAYFSNTALSFAKLSLGGIFHKNSS